MELVRRCWARSPLLTGLALLHLLLVPLFALAAWADPALVQGVGRWLKPLKFAASIALYLATVAWLLPDTVDDPRRARRLAALIGVAMTLEMLGIGVQAARGTPSHFNTATTFDWSVYHGMGGLIAANTVAVAMLGLGAWRRWRATGDGYAAGVALGIAVLLAGSAVGGAMIAHGAHTVGAPDGGSGLPLVGWSRTHGDLRIAHFVGLHALQGLPLLAWRVGPRAAALAAAGWLVVTGVLALQAAWGVPLLAGG
jgi:hypothetical protein